MPDRLEILNTLSGSQKKLFARYRSFSQTELERLCTPSVTPDGAAWTPKDHLSHLARVERAFQGMIRRTLCGETDPVGFSQTGLTSRPEILAWIHQQNQAYADAHHEDSLDTILADLTAVRQSTLTLLEQLTDEQLSLPVTGAPWADGTIGGLLITYAHHEAQHLAWVEEGLRQSL